MQARWRVSLVLSIVVALLSSGPAVARRDAPTRLSDAEFWRIVSTFSEEGGHFASENFVSNETEYQAPIATLTRTIKPGGVYVGVGPDQNFTYISALRPSLAFIVDIRRQNMLHHLMYKAIFELSPTRAEFLARLFARAAPKPLGRDAPIGALVAALLDAPEDEAMSARVVRDVIMRLTAHHGFDLSSIDERGIERLLDIFHLLGPDISYAQNSVVRGVDPASGRRIQLSMFPAFADLVTRTDEAGINHGYLADEARYRRLREMHLRNAIVPVVGDFAGPKALRAVGDYARRHKATIRALYTSNVEQYLFQNRVWDRYYANVGSMPLDRSSTFIRAFFPTTTASGGIIIRPTDPPQYFGTGSGPRGGFVPSESLLSSAQELLAAVDAGTIRGYLDVIRFSK